MNLGIVDETAGESPKKRLRDMDETEAAKELRAAADHLERTVDESVKRVKRLKRKEGVLRFVGSTFALIVLAYYAAAVAAIVALAHRVFFYVLEWLKAAGL